MELQRFRQQTAQQQDRLAVDLAADDCPFCGHKLGDEREAYTAKVVKRDTGCDSLEQWQTNANAEEAEKEAAVDEAREAAAQKLWQLRELKRAEKRTERSLQVADNAVQEAHDASNQLALWQIKCNRIQQLADLEDSLRQLEQTPVIDDGIREELRRAEDRKRAIEAALHQATVKLAENQANRKALQEQLDTNTQMLKQAEINREAKGLLQTLRMALGQDR